MYKFLLIDAMEEERSVGVNEFHSGTTRLKYCWQVVEDRWKLYSSLFEEDLVSAETNDKLCEVDIFSSLLETVHQEKDI